MVNRWVRGSRRDRESRARIYSSSSNRNKSIIIIILCSGCTNCTVSRSVFE